VISHANKADELASRLAIVARGVSTRTAVLVLSGIQLFAQDGRLDLAATDMEVSLRTELECSVDGEGTVVVPGRLLLDISRSLPDSDVTIEHKPEETVVVVTSGTANYMRVPETRFGLSEWASAGSSGLSHASSERRVRKFGDGGSAGESCRSPSATSGSGGRRHARDGRSALLPDGLQRQMRPRRTASPSKS
jgi:DNA polymerase III beta subunit, N-terminal domain